MFTSMFCSAADDWVKLGRWEYDPKRGLRITTKNPQLPDSELKKLGYGEHDNNEAATPSGGNI
jgi:hypothetical protein